MQNWYNPAMQYNTNVNTIYWHVNTLVLKNVIYLRKSQQKDVDESLFM